MKKRELIGALIITEAMADVVADDHDHDCPIGEAARETSAACRGIRTALMGGNGPAQVATDRYRDNWDAIFGKQPIGQA